MIGNIPIMIGMLVGMLSYHRTHPTSDNAEWELLNSLKKNSLDAFFFQGYADSPRRNDKQEDIPSNLIPFQAKKQIKT